MKKPVTALLLAFALAMPLAHAEETADRITLDEAAAQVRVETGGRILSATTEEENGKRVHRIKVLTPDNRVKVVSVEAGDK